MTSYPPPGAQCAQCGRYRGDAPLARVTESACVACGMELFGTITSTTERLAEFRPNVLAVHADVCDLLERFGDEAKLFDFLGKLKDLLA